MNTELLDAAAALLHLRGMVCTALRTHAPQSEVDALLVAEDRARREWEVLVIASATSSEYAGDGPEELS